MRGRPDLKAGMNKVPMTKFGLPADEAERYEAALHARRVAQAESSQLQEWYAVETLISLAGRLTG